MTNERVFLTRDCSDKRTGSHLVKSHQGGRDLDELKETKAIDAKDIDFSFLIDQQSSQGLRMEKIILAHQWITSAFIKIEK
ncbi:hypothetical protein OROMI_024341 [Orobanche minor]